MIFVFMWAVSNAAAQERAPESPQSNKTTPTQNASAPRIVREANRLLLDEKPAEALDEYQKARKLRPDAREIAFGEGLAHYRLGEYDQAREAFNRAAGGAADRLADDALYSLGACDHSEALAAQDPKAALGKLESAMRKYQSVLADRSDHPAAKDANLKAASYWRQLKQQMKQQQQQQQNSDQNKDQQQNDQQQQQNADQNKDQQDKQQQEQNQDQQSQKADQKQQEQKEQQQQSAEKDQEQKDQQVQKQQAEKEEVSREQAERKLREMMQALRDRKKLRREEIKSPPYRPSEKDW